MDWAGDFGLYRGCAIEIQILKQYHAQHYTYVKQNTVNIVILLQLYQVLLKWLIAPWWIDFIITCCLHLGLSSGVNFFQEKLVRYFFLCRNFFFMITGENHKNCKINPSLRLNFSLQFQYNIKQTSGENKKNID